MQKNKIKRYLFHRVVYVILHYSVGRIIKRIMRYRCSKHKGPSAPSLLVANHNLNIDPVFVAMGFSRHMYFLASEHAFRKGFSSSLLRFFFAPIPINKSISDIYAIKEIIRRLKSGASVCVFAEGDRSYNGMTGPMQLSIAKLAKTCKTDLITFRIEGGYFTAPRWAKKQRRGKMAGNFVNRYTAEELQSMTATQISSHIERDIYEDAYERQKARLVRYKGKDLAEHIELVLYLCPNCTRLGTIRSEGERFYCACGLSAAYTETGLLSGEDLPYSTITEWDRWQSNELNEIVSRAGDRPICMDEGQTLRIVSAATDSTPAGTGAMSISRDVFHCAGYDFGINQITRLVIVGRMTLLFALKGGDTYEVHSDTPRSALKYKEIYRILTNK